MSVTSVYIIAKREEEKFVAPVKVGMTGAVGSRVSTIQTSTPFKISLFWEFCFPARDIAQHFEWAFHKVFAQKRTHGEWFDLDPFEALEAMRGNVAAAHGRVCGTKMIPSLTLAQFMYLCHAPDQWVLDAVAESVDEVRAVKAA